MKANISNKCKAWVNEDDWLFSFLAIYLASVFALLAVYYYSLARFLPEAVAACGYWF
jgi:hypothetical protein